MYKVLLVDDEENVIKSLLLSVPWESLGLEIVACASSAETALSSMQQAAADIVITDIRMPGMDGITLCQHILEENPHCQIIVISGYAEFEYAQQCLRLGVRGYCLKPVDSNELSTQLTACINALRRHDNQISEDFVAIMEERDISGMQDFLFKQNFEQPYFYVAVTIGDFKLPPNSSEIYTAKIGKNISLLLSSSPIDVTTLGASSNSSIYGIGYDKKLYTIATLRRAISHCMVCAHQFFITGKSGIWDSAPDEYGREIIATLVQTAAQYDIAGFTRRLQELLVRDCDRLFNVKSAYLLYTTVVALPILADSNDEMNLYSFGQMVAEYPNLKEMIKLLVIALSDTKSENEALTGVNTNVLTILQYINKNYANKISLQTMSDELHLSKNYIGQLFKKEIGLSYSKYISDLRIEKAKELLLRSDYSTAAICETIGFNDYFYFIRAFKKDVGCTPNQYRNKYA